MFEHGQDFSLVNDAEVVKKLALQKYEDVLHRIVDNPFVTPASIAKKTIVLERLQELDQKLKSQGFNFSIISFAYGSLGVGLAHTMSDLDGKLYYEGEDEPIRPAMDELFPYKYEFDMTHFEPWKFSKKLEEALRPEIIALICTPKSEWDVYRGMQIMGDVALIFGPSLEEFIDPEKKAIARQWRKKFLEELLNKYPDQAHQIWSEIQKYLKDTYILYENQIMGESSKRPPRVQENMDKVINSYISSEKFHKRRGALYGKLKAYFLGKHLRQEATERFARTLQVWRQNINFPDLDTMLQAFEIENP